MRTPDADRDAALLLLYLIHRAATLLISLLRRRRRLLLLLLLHPDARGRRWKRARRRTGLLGGPQAPRAYLPVVAVLQRTRIYGQRVHPVFISPTKCPFFQISEIYCGTQFELAFLVFGFLAEITAFRIEHVTRLLTIIPDIARTCLCDAEKDLYTIF